MTCVFATTGVAATDREFPTLPALARHIVALRAAAPLDALGERPEIGLLAAMVGREAIPNGASIAVRVRDGRNGGRGTLLGYAFLETLAGGARNLMAAILSAQAFADGGAIAVAGR